MSEHFLVFSTRNYDYFRKELCLNKAFEQGRLERKVFPDGERYQRFLQHVRGRHAVLIGGTISEADTMELFDLACGLVYHGAETLTMVVPFYGYSTMERVVKPGEIVTGKTRALLFSAIPIARLCNEIVLLDLHTGGIPHYFEGQIRPNHLHCEKLIVNVIKSITVFPNVILASTDAGRAKWVENLANRMGLDAAFVYKRRLSGTSTEIRGINAEVKGRHVVIYDDMIRTGGSLIKAARAYQDAGAVGLTAIASHGVFPGEALQRIADSQLFERVIVTNSHPRSVDLTANWDPTFFQVYSITPHVAEFLLNREDLDRHPFHT